MKVTPQDYEAKIAKEYRHISGEDISARYICGTTYFIGSELATLRLFRHFAMFHKHLVIGQDKSEGLTFYCKVDFNNQFITIEEE